MTDLSIVHPNVLVRCRIAVTLVGVGYVVLLGHSVVQFAHVLTEMPLSPTRTKAIATAIQTIRLTSLERARAKRSRSTRSTDSHQTSARSTHVVFFFWCAFFTRHAPVYGFPTTRLTSILIFEGMLTYYHVAASPELAIIRFFEIEFGPDRTQLPSVKARQASS
ncbi:MAG: hypothetical protein WAL97_07225 [Halobacteriota archaeon]